MERKELLKQCQEEKNPLTIAFVFALHMYKPSQFYILDEVEAALDKENSKRFAEIS